MGNKILVIDDEAPAREKIGRFLKRMDQNSQVTFASNAQQGIENLHTGTYDLMLLDIQMPQMDAFEMLQQVNLENLPTLVFSTAYDQYALQAFEMHAVDYLLKPFDFHRFEKSINRALKIQIGENDKNIRLTKLLREGKLPKQKTDVVWINKSGKIIPVYLNTIEYISADGNYITLHSQKQKFLLRQSLKEFYERLDQNQFVRVHKSYIVNRPMIKELIPKSHGDLFAIMKNKTKIPVSRQFRSGLIG